MGKYGDYDNLRLDNLKDKVVEKVDLAYQAGANDAYEDTSKKIAQLRADLAKATGRIAELEDDLAINKNAYSTWYKRCLEVEAGLTAFKGSHCDLVECVIDLAADIAAFEATNNDLAGAGRMIDGVCEVLKQVGCSEFSSKLPSAYVRDLIVERDKLRDALRRTLKTIKRTDKAFMKMHRDSDKYDILGDAVVASRKVRKLAALLGDGEEVHDGHGSRS